MIKYYLKYYLAYIPLQLGIIALSQEISITKNETLLICVISNIIFFAVFIIFNLFYYRKRKSIHGVVNIALLVVLISAQSIYIFVDAYGIRKSKDEFYGNLNTLTVIPRMSTFYYNGKNKYESMGELSIGLDQEQDSGYVEVERRKFSEKRMTFKVDPDLEYRVNISFWGMPISQVETRNLYKSENRIVRIVTPYKRPVKFIFHLTNDNASRMNRLILRLKAQRYGQYIRETKLVNNGNELISKIDLHIWSNRNKKYPYYLYIQDSSETTYYTNKFNFDATQFEMPVVLNFYNVELK